MLETFPFFTRYIARRYIDTLLVCVRQVNFPFQPFSDNFTVARYSDTFASIASIPDKYSSCEMVFLTKKRLTSSC